MVVKKIELIWITVKDLKAAISYYTEVLGLKLLECNEEYKWAELQGHEGGARLGITQECEQEKTGAGQNAVVTFKVKTLEEKKQEMLAKGAKCDGDVIEIPGHVKLQSMIDPDGNSFQLCQDMHHSCQHC